MRIHLQYGLVYGVPVCGAINSHHRNTVTQPPTEFDKNAACEWVCKKCKKAREKQKKWQLAEMDRQIKALNNM